MRMNELSSASERIVMSFRQAGRCAVALGQAVVVWGGISALACDDESARSMALPPAASDRSAATPRTADAGARSVEEPTGALLSDDESGVGGESGARDGVDGGAPEAGAGGAVAPDAGSLPRSNDCCTESPLPGCSNGPVLECVCAGDAACCSEAYDALCVTEAITRCALACEAPPPDSDCSTPSELPSCTVPEIAECVCAIDPFCCTFRFDANCVTLAAAECSGAQPPGQGAPP